MSRSNVKYDADQRATAKAENKALATIDLDFNTLKESQIGRATYQMLCTAAEADEILNFAMALTEKRNKAPKGKAKKSPIPKQEG